MSLEIDKEVNWSWAWWDNGDTEAFFLKPGGGASLQDAMSGLAQSISNEEFTRNLEIEERLRTCPVLDIAIARRRKSKRSRALDE